MHNPHRLELRNISKSFGQINAIANISLRLKPGAILALLGDNGAGKSTLIKIISGFHRPDTGKIFIDGDLVSTKSFCPIIAKSLGVQTVYQSLGLIDTLSITRNFFLTNEIKKNNYLGALLDWPKMHDIVAEEIRALGLKRKLSPKNPVEKLSGGERQVIAIAKARYFGARILILDEPTSALSLTQTNRVLRHIKDSALADVSIIYITHTLSHIESLVSDIAIMYHGRMLGQFLPKDIPMSKCENMIMFGQELAA